MKITQLFGVLTSNGLRNRNLRVPQLSVQVLAGHWKVGVMLSHNYKWQVRALMGFNVFLLPP